MSMTHDEYVWCMNAQRYGGDFIRCFAEAIMRADAFNYEILKPAFVALMTKYPDYLKENPNTIY